MSDKNKKKKTKKKQSESSSGHLCELLKKGFQNRRLTGRGNIPLAQNYKHLFFEFPKRFFRNFPDVKKQWNILGQFLINPLDILTNLADNPKKVL